MNKVKRPADTRVGCPVFPGIQAAQAAPLPARLKLSLYWNWFEDETEHPPPGSRRHSTNSAHIGAGNNGGLRHNT